MSTADPPPADALCRWHGARYAALPRDDLYDLLALRQQVFILEQGPYLDIDGLDRRAWHLLARAPDGSAVAGLRLLDPGVKHAEPVLGRVVCAAAWRGRGLGRALVARGIAQAEADWPDQPLRISAQARLQDFYASLGFVARGPEYLEDGIPHREMWRSAPAR